MQTKHKLCSGCKKEKKIWKRHEGERYCQSCWSCHSGKDTKKPTAKKPLAPRSSKKEKLDALYTIIRKQWMKDHPMCQAKLPGCSLEAHDIHHKEGKVGELYLDTTNFVSICRNCHTWVHSNPKQAKELGLYH
jgi:hypothetical protein